MRDFDVFTDIDIVLVLEDIDVYLKKGNGFDIPSIEEFCHLYNYDEKDLHILRFNNRSLDCRLRKITRKAILTLERFLILNTDDIIVNGTDKEGKRQQYQLDKKGIILLLNSLRRRYAFN